jgi:hypothetical protein
MYHPGKQKSWGEIIFRRSNVVDGSEAQILQNKAELDLTCASNYSSLLIINW